MFTWLRQVWDESNAASRALEELQADNSLSALASGRLRVSEKKINEWLTTVEMEGVREISLAVEEDKFTVAARSGRFFWAHLSLPLQIRKVVFTPYRRRLVLTAAGGVSSVGSSLRQRATGYAVLALLRYALNPNAPIQSLQDPTIGFAVRGDILEIDLHRLPDAKPILNREYELLGERVCPLHFVTIDGIDCREGFFEIRSSVNWDALSTRLREIVFG